MTDEAVTLWNRVLESLSGRVGAQMIDKLLRPLEAVDACSGVLLLRAPNDFTRDWVTKAYAGVIEEHLRTVTGEDWALHWSQSPPMSLSPSAKVPPPRVNPPPRTTPRTRPATAAAAPRTAVLHPSSMASPGGMHCGLSPRYTFDQFVTGPSNQIAHAMSLALANLTGRRVNVLFLCGGTGLGKTHLSNAIGHQILEQNPHARIVYVSAETFTNDYVTSIQQKKMEEFRGRYRNDCDALMLDDVQFLAGKEGTQDEFFHTFNTLYQLNKPIVLTSDVLPQKLQGMAERLLSRFASGLVGEIYAPEMETRVAILRKKAIQEHVQIDDEAAFAVAAAVSSNVRELEGTLMKLAIKASMSGRTVIDGALVRETLRIGARPTVTTVEDIQRAVCEHFRIKLQALTGRDRHREVALPRQIAMYLARVHLGTSFPQIGAKFNGKDHTTVISSVRKVEKLLVASSEVQQAVESISARLGFTPSQPGEKPSPRDYPSSGTGG